MNWHIHTKFSIFSHLLFLFHLMPRLYYSHYLQYYLFYFSSLQLAILEVGFEQNPY